MLSRGNKSFQLLLKDVATHHGDQKPFVLFKYPGEDRVKAIYQQSRELLTSPDLDHSGFVFGSFGGEMPDVVMRADSISSAVVEPLEPSGGVVTLPKASAREKADYKRKVSLAVEDIRKGALRKVVLSRQIRVPTSKTPVAVFSDLISHYPTAFCYCWYHPEVGCWVGATPETLLQFSEGRFKTHSLAGTLKKDINPHPQWGEKEIKEQQIVTDYILGILSAKGIASEASAADTIAAGSLWHLKTTISGELASEKVTSLVRALHPTPAVCGIPLEEARAFLKKNEGYSRKYYTGFLGELNLEREGETRLFVNLRCAELSDSEAVIYVGGGITADSDPEQEWEETQAKSQTVLRVL